MPARPLQTRFSGPLTARPTASVWVSAATFALWLGVGFSAVAWGLRLWPEADQHPVVELPGAAPATSTSDVAQGLGAVRTVTAAPTLASRLQLLGVMADAEGGGAALIAVDGQAPKVQRVGKPVLEGLVLQSVQARSAALGARADGPAELTLSLPTKR